MGPHRPNNSAIFAAFGVLLAAAGCDRALARGPGDVTTTRATVTPRPESLPAATHTVDASGFVDNGGRFAEDRVRTEMSGMRVTEMGAQRVTGTPGSGLPVPFLDPKTPARPRERPIPDMPGRATAAGAPSEAVAGRIAEAQCDRARSCGRVGGDKAWPSAVTCMEGSTSIAREELGSAGCPDGFDAEVVASCLSALRLAACNARVDSLAALPECNPRSLCLAR